MAAIPFIVAFSTRMSFIIRNIQHSSPRNADSNPIPDDNNCCHFQFERKRTEMKVKETNHRCSTILRLPFRSRTPYSLQQSATRTLAALGELLENHLKTQKSLPCLDNCLAFVDVLQICSSLGVTLLLDGSVIIVFYVSSFVVFL